MQKHCVLFLAALLGSLTLMANHSYSANSRPLPRRTHLTDTTLSKPVYLDIDVPFDTTAISLTKRLFIKELLNNIKAQKIAAYSPSVKSKKLGEFTLAITWLKLMSNLKDTLWVTVADENGVSTRKKHIDPFAITKITAYRLKQQTYTDKQTGQPKTTIIGIALLAPRLLSNGDAIGTRPVCWLKYADCKAAFAAMDAANPAKKLYTDWDTLFTGGTVRE